jgi:2-phospho-L-lactate guanylyltransferase
MRTAAIVPVKSFAKRRLAGRLDDAARETLVREMFQAVLAALVRVPALDAIFVVTPNGVLAADARAAGAVVVEDCGAGYSAAALSGIRRALASGFDRVLVMPADTPLVDAVELDAWLRRTELAGTAVAIVPDRGGSGTNGLLLCPPDVIAPAFGPGSLERHRTLAAAAGASAAVERLASIALDVDTPADLAAFAALSRRRSPLLAGR